MAKTITLEKIIFNKPAGGASSTDSNSYTTRADVQTMMDNFEHLTANDVQTIIDDTLSKIAKAENTKY